ncbi:hypothetical protein ACFQY5_01035 [Paeniroseomonas aquatica]|uniref:hypothetical protein n=1 Tax=Paeniroseomonas aquatica TaxID=373043 RepID=UPI0036147DA0
MLKSSNFLFTESREPAMDARVIRECLEEAKLCDDLGVEVLWLAEHHFDGNAPMSTRPPSPPPSWPRPGGSRSASPSPRSRCTTRCGWPSRSPCSTISARAG